MTDIRFPDRPSPTRSREVDSWSTDSRERAWRILESYPDKRSAVMPLLYLAMVEHGHLTDRAIADVARWVGLTPAQVLTVVSFYTMYKQHPIGRYLISVCTSLPCMLQGADETLGAIEEETGVPDGETGAEGLFSVEHVECIGACGGAPAVEVNYELVEGLVPDKARELCRWLRDGRPDVVLSDEMQQLFGGQRSFEWGPSDPEGAVAPVPAFGPYGTSASDPPDNDGRPQAGRGGSGGHGGPGTPRGSHDSHAAAGPREKSDGPQAGRGGSGGHGGPGTPRGSGEAS